MHYFFNIWILLELQFSRLNSELSTQFCHISKMRNIQKYYESVKNSRILFSTKVYSSYKRIVTKIPQLKLTRIRVINNNSLGIPCTSIGHLYKHWNNHLLPFVLFGMTTHVLPKMYFLKLNFSDFVQWKLHEICIAQCTNYAFHETTL